MWGLRAVQTKRFFFHSLKSATLFKCLKERYPLVNIRGCNFQRLMSNNAKPLKLADIGEGIAKVEIVQWLVKEGDSIKEFDPVCEAKSDKASITISSRYTGIVKEILHQENDLVNVGDTLILMDTEIHNEEIDSKEAESSNFVPTSPAVKRLANEYNVDLTKIKATGEHGRITKNDVIAFVANSSDNVEINKGQEAHEQEAKIEKLTGMRRIMFKTMSLSNQIPHMYFSDLLDVTDYWRELSKFNNANKEKLKFSQLCFSVKAVSRALSKYPLLNSQIQNEDIENPAILHQNNHNIGIAMNTPHGLVVPVVKCVQDKTVREIAFEINELKALAIIDKLAIEQISHGTFTISSMGNISGRYFGPCILPPQVGLLALGAVTNRDVSFHNDQNPQKNYMLPVSIACDHRVIDGATVANFIAVYNECLTNPIKFMLDSK